MFNVDISNIYDGGVHVLSKVMARPMAKPVVSPRMWQFHVLTNNVIQKYNIRTHLFLQV